VLQDIVYVRTTVPTIALARCGVVPTLAATARQRDVQLYRDIGSLVVEAGRLDSHGLMDLADQF